MKKRLVLAVLAATALTLTSARAQTEVFTANLDGPSESPTNASPGTGFATVTLDLTLNTMRVQVSFSGLTGTTTASHIHAATPTPFSGTAGVATQTPTFSSFPLGVTSGTMDQTLDLTLTSSYNPSYVSANGGTAASAEAALKSAIEQGRAYLNIHTQTFPSGEIRGFLVAVPEPGTVSLLVIGSSALLLGYRRMRRR